MVGNSIKLHQTRYDVSDVFKQILATTIETGDLPDSAKIPLNTIHLVKSPIFLYSEVLYYFSFGHKDYLLIISFLFLFVVYNFTLIVRKPLDFAGFTHVSSQK